MRTLPQHRPQPVIQPPLIFSGLGPYALAGWHRHYRLQSDTAKMEEIEAIVNTLPPVDMSLIKKLRFYQPIK